MNLYDYDNQFISVDTLVQAMQPYIKKGDTLFLEIDTMRFGNICPGLTKDKLMEALFTVFYRLVGEEGNIVVPTFSYSWGDDSPHKYFDVNNTPGGINRPGGIKIGIFSEYFRKRKDVGRSLDPMFSFGVWGKDKAWLLKNTNTSFGKGSIYEKAHQLKAKLISFGLKKYDPTFIHYVEQYFHEQIEKLDYRFIKKFTGTLVGYDGAEREAEHYCFSRYLDLPLKFDETRLVLDLLAQNKMVMIKVGNAEIGLSDCDAVFEMGIKGLQADRHYFMKNI